MIKIVLKLKDSSDFSTKVLHKNLKLVKKYLIKSF